MDRFIYIYVEPGEEPDICAGSDVMIERLVGRREDDLTFFEYKGAYILYDKTAAERNEPMNRLFQFDNGDITAVSGDFAIIANNPEEFGYVGLSEEQQKTFYKMFEIPHIFIAAFGKLLVFQHNARTELSLLAAIDVHETPEEEEEEDGES